MNSPSEDSSKLEALQRTLLEIRDGYASDADISQLQDLLLNDRETRLIYLRENQLTNMLENHSIEMAVSVPKIARLRIPPSHLMSAALGAGIAAAIALFVIFNPFALSNHQNEASEDGTKHQPYASLSSDYDAIIGGSPATLSQGFREGELALEGGIAQLSFRNGAQIVLEGRCGFEIIDEMTVVLTHGKMWAYCPEDAYGFKVLAPNGREIIDLGTEFGIEISSSGTTNVHVFDGLVDVISPNSKPQRVTAGSALTWSNDDTSISHSEAQLDKFITPETLAKKRFQAYKKSIASRDDLLLYYDFETQKGRRTPNSAPHSSKKTQGIIRGTNTVHGRFNSNRALQFENTGDRVELKMPPLGSASSFTTAAWLKIDRFDSRISTIINSSNWEPGSIHFQIGQEGTLKIGINGGWSLLSNRDVIGLGKWHFIAVTWNFETKKTQLFCDGLPIPSKSSIVTTQITPLQPQFGVSQIGAWTETVDYRDNSLVDPPRLSRELRGRIDEIMIFDHALTEKEILDLYTIGSP